MRLLSLLLPAGLLLAGCAGPPAAQDGSAPGKAKAKSPAPPKPGAPVIEPVAAFTGKIVLVNAPLKYVVIEGVIGRLPPVDQSLNVYRDGQKVGVVVVSNQSRGANFAADISVGDARVGDTVRSD
jgi:hypothetical protein